MDEHGRGRDGGGGHAKSAFGWRSARGRSTCPGWSCDGRWP